MISRFTFHSWAIASLLVGGLAVARVAAEELAQPTSNSGDYAPAHGSASQIARCTVRKDPNGWWLVDPTGGPFFSLGVCMFNQGSLIEDYDPAKPSYVALRHYDAPEAWADASLLRLKTWGFTTIGGWSEYHMLLQSAKQILWLTPVLHLGSTAGAPWFDMWDEKIVRRIEEVAEKSITPLRGDPRVIGYYSDNEIGWWNAILWKMTLEQPASSGQRQRLIALVREAYGDDWNALLRDFNPQNASNWQELDQSGMLWLRPGSDGIQTMRRFLRLVADRYYQLMCNTIRKFDPEALYLGERYQSFYYPEVVRASGRHVDVVSTNLNASWNDGTFLRSYLDTLHALAEKPVLVSEFYMAAKENRSGNKNAVGGFPTVTTQTERAKAASNTLRALLRLPYVVGADWFQYYDEPPHGRKLDGEDFNFGLVDIHDQPYAEVTAAFTSLELTKLKSAPSKIRPDATKRIPRAPANPFAEFVFMRALKSWDRERGFVPPETDEPTGDLYVCWGPEALYFGVYVLDIVEPEYYQDSEIPEIDRATWTIRVADQPPITVRIGAGKAAVVSDSAVRVESLSGVYNDVRCITAVMLPAAQFGKKQLERGDQIDLETSYATHGRAYRIEWKGTFVLGD